jgi:hypothetical protein
VAEVAPRKLDGSDLADAIRYVHGHVKAPAVGALLRAAGCLDPEPQAGKRKRIRAAIEATQERDDDGAATLRLVELVIEAEQVEERRSETMRVVRQAVARTSPREVVEAEDGFRIELGIGSRHQHGTTPMRRLTLSVLPDMHATPVMLTLAQARELYVELGRVGMELKAMAARDSARTDPTVPGRQ